MKKYFSSIIWPNKERVKNEFLIVAIGSVVFVLFTLGINTLAKYLMNLIF